MTPRKGTRGTYQSPGMPSPIGFTVDRVEDNLCWATYDNAAESLPFIWRFKDGLNIYHSWPGKDHANA